MRAIRRVIVTAALSIIVALAAVLPAGALFIFHPAISAAVWGPHPGYVAGPTYGAVGYRPYGYVPYGTGAGAAYVAGAAAGAAATAGVLAVGPAAATVSTTTTVVVPPFGSYVRALPSTCTSLNVHSVTYFECGAAFYQPTFLGKTLMYEVVKNPA